MTRQVSITELPNQHPAQPIALRYAGFVPQRPQPSLLDQERAAGVRKALGHIHAGSPGRALYELVRSVERQARIEGLGSLPVTPLCPCGGRCPGGSR